MVKLIAGLMGSSVATGSAKMADAEQIRPFLAMLRKHDVKELDTARVYNAGKSEEMLGNIPEAKDQFVIATKAPGFSGGSLAYQKVLDNCNASLAALKQSRIELYYFHGPDRQTPLEESCRAINQLHREGKIVQFGVSNYSAAEVEEIQSLCDANAWLRPTVYQGGYNPLGRTNETDLFPTLKKFGMRFYGFSPLAGGFFSRPAEQLREPPAGGRMDQMKHFKDMYVSDLTLRHHDLLTEECKKAGVELKEATLRYMAHHSALGPEDGLILGASSQQQMEENLVACEHGPLPENVVAAFERLWTEFKEGGHALPYCV